ncbi:MAG: triose-phosphate isomerase [Cycloclasticus sp.]|jgi:triosephosphate isomerase|nr:MAG: triose-phosphate isomerase [Cycloclasticus sp. Phe_18]MBV1912222.1 triose-phosphate isomerase [Cycloclasticus sp.]MDF1688207.1 triose-phosphate isomerase [Cycloclasticus sp.]MEE4290603.1 triose-phosphate isomerase [Cycloclasticus sp.]
MRQPLVIGNWKMNGSLAFTSELLHTLEDRIDDKISCEVGVCTPFVYIKLATELTANSVIKVGAQTVSEFKAGAYTGEVSALMLKELGADWVLVGHSERRTLFNEVNAALVQKVLAAQSAGLTPVYCMGETEADYKSGHTFSVIADQIGALLDSDDVDLNNLVLAYEPVWAIGTGLTATPDEAQKVHAFIRTLVKEKNIKSAEGLRILYGGSVKPDNALSLFGQDDIDGGLIGGASLDADAFISICQQA